MDDSEKPKIINGTILTPANTNKREYTPRDLNDEQLALMNHAEWLEGFSQQMGTSTTVKMTPFRQGVVTRLHWASKWVKLLEKKIRQQEVEIIQLKEKLNARTDTADGSISG